MTGFLGSKHGTSGDPSTCRCGHLFTAVTGVTCLGWSQSGGASGMVQQCGCRTHTTFPLPAWQDPRTTPAEYQKAVAFALAGDPYAEP